MIASAALAFFDALAKLPAGGERKLQSC